MLLLLRLANLLEFLVLEPLSSLENPGYHHVKAHVLMISEMWFFLGVGHFKGELLLLKVNRA